MTDLPPTRPVATEVARPTSRRSLLIGSLALLAPAPLLGACTNPRIEGAPQTPPPPVSRAPHPQQQQILAAIRFEADLAALTKSSAARTGAHQDHLIALQARDPETRPDTVPAPDFRHTPPPVPPGNTGLKLPARAAEASEVYRRSGTESTGQLALFWASLATFAAAEATGSGFDVPAGPPVRPMASVTEADAWADLVSNLHAATYAVQTALAFLTRDDARTASENLTDLRDSSAAASAWLRASGREVPAASAAYELPSTPRDAASARALMAEVNTALLPHLGQWVVASKLPASRELAVRRLIACGRTCVRAGGSLVAWPGWA